MKISRQNLSLSLAITSLAFIVGVAGCKPPEEKSGGGGALLLMALLNKKEPGPMYNGFTELPGSITNPASNTSSTVNTGNGLVVIGNDELEAITEVYNPIREVVKLNRDIVYSIGSLVSILKTIDPGDALLQVPNGDWDNLPAKIQYQSDATYVAGGRKLEVWWNNAGSPYGNLKALELVFNDPNPNGTDPTQDIQGHIWARFLNEETGTSLGMIFVRFEALFSTTKDKKMAVIIQGAGAGGNDSAHFYVTKAGATDTVTIDGTFTAKSFADGITKQSAARAYVFSGAGNDDLGRAVVRAAFPLVNNNNTNPYGTTIIENMGEIYTDWLLWYMQNDGTAPISLTTFNAYMTLASCPTLTAPGSANPTGADGSAAADIKTSVDCIRTHANPAIKNTTFGKEIYFVSEVQNPGFYAQTGSGLQLIAVGDLTGSSFDGDTDFATILAAANTVNTVRQTGASDYKADFLPVTVSGIDLNNGTCSNVPTGGAFTTWDESCWADSATTSDTLGW